VVAEDDRLAVIVEERVAGLGEVAAYRPGSFYTRELPAIEAVLSGAGALDLIFIDGYVDLDPAGRPGLGAHLHRSTGTAVVGVAKTRFHTATHAIAVRRGSATRPLYVTAAGIDLGHAAMQVQRLAGVHRLPDALRRVDALARTRGRGEPRDAPRGPVAGRPFSPPDGTKA
jgi:deoxyribonuclease V